MEISAYLGEKKVLSVNVTQNSVSVLTLSLGYQAVMNELFRVIGESLNFTLTKQ